MESRKKILVVIPYFPPNAGGGAEKYAYNISRRLSRDHDWDVVVVTSTDKKQMNPARRTNGIKIYRLPFRFKLSNSPVSISWFWKIRKIIRDENPDIINIHAPVPGIGDIAAAMCGNKPLAVNYHMGTMKKHKSLLNPIIWIYEHILLKRMLKKAVYIISSSDYVRNEFLVSFRHKTRTITPAVDSEFFHPTEKPVEGNNILFVGALSRGDKHKGLDILLRSCQKLKDSFPDLKLTVVGGGEGVDYFRKMAEDLGVDGMVTFTGRLEGMPWAESYRNATIYAHPSSNDSFPLVIAEAMATGLPVASTTVGGIPTLVDDGETGILVPPRDEPAFTAALRRLLTDTELSKKLGGAGRSKAVAKLSWNVQSKKSDDLFRTILGGHRVQRKVKIALVSPYYHPVYGHIYDYIKQSADYYKKLPAYDAFVITRHRWSRQYQIRVDDDITVYKLPAFFWFPFGLLSPFRSKKIRKIFDAEQPELIQLHVPAPNMASATLSAARNLPVALTYHARGMIHKKFLSGTAIKLYDNSFREGLFKSAVAVIIPSPVILHKSLQKFRFKTHVIIPRIKPSIFANALKTKKRFRKRRSQELKKTTVEAANENKPSSIAISGLSNSGRQHIWNAHMYQNLQQIESILSHGANIVQLSAYFPPHLGGVEVVTQEISNELASRGNRVHILTSNIGSKHMPSQIQDTNLLVDKLNGFEFAHTPFMPGLFWKLCKVKKPAIFHLHLSQVFLPEIMWTVAKYRKIPYVIHFHLDVDPSGPLGMLFVLYKKIFWPVLMRGAAHVIALSPDQVKMVRDRYQLDESKVSYIPNGVSDKFLQIGEKSRTIHKPLRLFYLGRLDRQKHFDRMIEALALVKSNVRLDIVGDGEERTKLENLASQLNLTNVTFHGPKTGDDRLQYYKQADVFVLPSDKEGMPLVMFEAMASGLPVIGSDVQGIREHLKNVGILVSNPSPATFAQAIDSFYEDREKLYPQLSKSSKEKAAQFSWPLLTNRIEALYRKISVDSAKKSKKIGAGLFASIAIWWLVFLFLRATQAVPDMLTNAVGFAFLATVPGALTVMCLPLKQLTGFAKLLVAVGFSVLELLLLGLSGNTVLQLFGVSRPLDTPYLIAEISILTAVLLLLARKYGVRQETGILQRIRKMFPTRVDRFVAVFPAIFIVMSALGAVSLNNGGTNTITMAMLICMALFSIFLAARSRKLSESSIIAAIFSLSLALLFMTSLRGWFTTGHDIQVEYQVFELAKANGAWKIQLLRVPYNACLSITILPTMLANLLKTLDPYVFKIYFQILFAVCPVAVYLIARNWLSKGLAFIATLYFISFPTFFTDMPFLNRQEMAFLFLAIMLYIMFLDELSLGLRRTMFLLFGTGLVVSHYSTTYAVILILAIAFCLWFPIRKIGGWLGHFKLFAKSSMQSIKSTAGEKRRFGLSMILVLAASSFIWTSILTQTGNNTLLVIKETVQAMQAGLSGQKLKSNDTNYSLSSFAATSPELELKDYVKNVIKPQRDKFASNYYPADSYDTYDISAVHERLLPLTSIGKLIENHGIDVNSINTAMRQGSAKLLQVFVLLGFIFVIFKRKHVRMMCSDFIALSYGSAIFVALQVFLPVLSVEYGLLRAFQQSLMVLGIFTVLGSVALFAWLPGRILKISVPVLLAIFFFLSNTGVITQSLGGYLAQLNLNNSGTYYDIYYTHEQEIAGIQWLNTEAGSWHNGIYSQNAPAQFDDQYTYGKLVTYTNLINESDIYPGIVIKNAYVYLGYDNVQDKQATISYNGDLVTYRYPLQFLDDHKDLIYANGGAAVYR